MESRLSNVIQKQLYKLRYIQLFPIVISCTTLQHSKKEVIVIVLFAIGAEKFNPPRF